MAAAEIHECCDCTDASMTCPPHHYVYPPPDGQTSEGVCKFCDAKHTGTNVADIDCRPAADSVDRLGRGDGLRWWRMNTPDRVGAFKRGFKRKD